MKYKIPFWVIWFVFFALLMWYIPPQFSENTAYPFTAIVPHLFLAAGFALPVFLVINEKERKETNE